MLKWCLRKKAVKLIEPDIQLSNVYMKKASNSLMMLDAAIDSNLPEWMATTAYYAMYFAFYSILIRCGIKSEIHECSIRLAHFFGCGNELKDAKERRIQSQYYVSEPVRIEKQDISEFIIRMEQKRMSLTDDDVKAIRGQIN